MKFAKYYDVTSKMNQLITKGELFSYTKDYYKKLFICMDTHDFWISRVLEGYNSEYDQEQGKWLIEREKIDKYAFIDFLSEKTGKEYEVNDRYQRKAIIDRVPVDKVVEYLILMDDDKGLEGWDSLECDSLEEAIEAIDGGYGIEVLV